MNYKKFITTGNFCNKSRMYLMTLLGKLSFVTFASLPPSILYTISLYTRYSRDIHLVQLQQYSISIPLEILEPSLELAPNPTYLGEICSSGIERKQATLCFQMSNGNISVETETFQFVILESFQLGVFYIELSELDRYRQLLIMKKVLTGGVHYFNVTT